MTYKRNSRPGHHASTGLKALPFRCAAAVAFLATTLAITAFAQEPSPLGGILTLRSPVILMWLTTTRSSSRRTTTSS